jgi:hypothetical protein
LAIAEGKLGKPAGIEDAGSQCTVEGLEAIDVKKAIVRVEKTGLRQRDEGRQHQEHDPYGRGDGTKFVGPNTDALVHGAIIARAEVLGKWSTFVFSNSISVVAGKAGF